MITYADTMPELSICDILQAEHEAMVDAPEGKEVGPYIDLAQRLIEMAHERRAQREAEMAAMEALHERADCL